MRESYNQIGAAAEAYNTGKTELAANITAKGVQASADETLPELAEKVSAIAQESYTIDGGEMYAKQLFGSLETPNYWNLYEVLANLLSDGRLVSYGGILLAEYYKGYDSLALEGAGAGGAYVVSDMENGVFKMYTNDTTHTWDTAFDGKGNRWVAYCFADEYHDFQITDTNTSPRSIYIGRKVGTITTLAPARTSKIIVTDGNELKSITCGSNANIFQFDRNLILRNITEQRGMIVPASLREYDSFYLEAKGDILGGGHTFSNTSNVKASVTIKADNISGFTGGWVLLNVQSSWTGHQPFSQVVIEAKTINGSIIHGMSNGYSAEKLYLLGVESGNMSCYQSARVKYGYLEGVGEKSDLISIRRTNPFYFDDFELNNGFCQNLNISDCIGYLDESMIFNHILLKLKQDEAGCGSGVTITLGATNLAKLTSQESQDLLASLRGTYGYTFA